MPFSLKVVRKFKGCFTKFNVDYDQLERILALKLMMDQRKTTLFTKKETSSKLPFKYEDFMSLFIGGMMSVFIVMLPPLYGMLSLFGTIMTYIILYMLADFSTVILDTRDKKIIGPTPIKGETLHMAKMVHVTIYLTKMMLMIMVIPLGVALITKGPIYFLCFLVETVMMMLLAIFMTAFIYYVLMSICSGEQLKDLINYIQMVFMIVVLVMQQVLPRLFDLVDGEITYSFKWYYYALVPFWMAAPFEIIENGVTHVGYIGLSMLSIVVPPLLFMIYMKKMSPYFEGKLMKINNSGPVSKQQYHQRGHFGSWLGKFICTSNSEYSCYQLAMRLMSNERKFKLQVYPQIALGIFFPILCCASFVEWNEPAHWLSQLRESPGYYFIYLMSMLGTQALLLTVKSENYKAAWIYRTLPLASPKAVYKGVFKAVSVKFLIPVIAYEIIFVVGIWGMAQWSTALVIGINTCTIFVMYFKVMNKSLPFSQDYDITDRTNSGRMMAATFSIFVIAFVHYKMAKMSYGHLIVAIISVVICVVFYQTSFNEIEGKSNKLGKTLEDAPI